MQGSIDNALGLQESCTKLSKLEQLECLHSENIHHHPMITHTIDSYQVAFIPIQNKVVYNYKSLNLTTLRIYLKSYNNYCMHIKFESSSF